MNYFIDGFRKAFDFKGRASRIEYWGFQLFSYLGLFILAYASNLFRLPWAVPVYNLVVAIPSLSVGIRRMHDSGHSAWFLLLPLYNLYLMFVSGNIGPNKYGADPKDASLNLSKARIPPPFKKAA